MTAKRLSCHAPNYGSANSSPVSATIKTADFFRNQRFFSLNHRMLTRAALCPGIVRYTGRAGPGLPLLLPIPAPACKTLMPPPPDSTGQTPPAAAPAAAAGTRSGRSGGGAPGQGGWSGSGPAPAGSPDSFHQRRSAPPAWAASSGDRSRPPAPGPPAGAGPRSPGW